MFRNNLTCVAGTLISSLLLQPVYGETKVASYPARTASGCAVRAENAGLVVGIQPVDDPNAQKAYFDTDMTREGFIPVFIVLENGSSEDSFIFDKDALKIGAFDPSKLGHDTPQQVAMQDTCSGAVGQYAQVGCVQERRLSPGEPDTRPMKGEPGKRPEPSPPGKNPDPLPPGKRPAPGPPGKNPPPTPRGGIPKAGPQVSRSAAPGAYRTSNVVGAGQMAELAFGLVETVNAFREMRRQINGYRIEQYMVKNEIQSNTLSPGASASGFLYVKMPVKRPGEKTRLLIPITNATTGETFVLGLDF